MTCWGHLWPVYRKPRALLRRFIHSVVRSTAPSASSRARSAFSPWNEIRIEHTIFLNTVPLLISVKSLKSSIPPPSFSCTRARSLDVCLSLFTPCMLPCSVCPVTPALMLCLGCCCLFSFLVSYFSTVYFAGDLLGYFVVWGGGGGGVVVWSASADIYWVLISSDKTINKNKYSILVNSEYVFPNLKCYIFHCWFM